MVGFYGYGLPEYVGVEAFTSEDERQHFTFNVCVSCLGITQRLACECDWFSLLDEYGTQSSARRVDLDDALVTWVKVREGGLTADERFRSIEGCLM